MKKAIIFFSVLVFILTAILLFPSEESTNDIFPNPPKVRSVFSPKAVKDDIDGRRSFFLNMLKDPVTNKIPKNIRSKELAFAKNNDISFTNNKTTNTITHTWSEIGPTDVGGRTRAIGIDVRNSNIIIAGGVSGGLYRSIDKGDSWTLVNHPNDYNGITSITQDIRTGNQDTWYYVTGEFAGNSAIAQGWSAYYYGNGVYKSIDNGLSWDLISGTESNLNSWDSMYDYLSKLIVNPQTGSVFICANGYGIIKFSAGAPFSSESLVLGGINAHYWSDIDIHADGTIIAFLSKSKPSSGVQNNQPGVYISTNDGASFTLISTTSDLPSNYDRGLVRISNSNNKVAYLFLVDDTTPYFYKIDLNTNTFTNRTSSIVEYSAQVDEKLGKQGDYNMTLAIHPDDENFVIAGSTSLFRSDDAFATTPLIDYTWIGGYGNPATAKFMYPNHHPDCHITVFDPNNHNQVWSGHDGGLSYCSNIKVNSTSSSFLAWVDKNSGYNVTQFYDIALNNVANNGDYLGGSQDNGSPYFTVNNNGVVSASNDLSSGDGSYCAFTTDCIFASSQYGTINRYTYNSATSSWEWTSCHPSGISQDDKLFIHPFVMDKADDKVMYYPVNNELWYNSNILEVANDLQSGTTTNWSSYAVAATGYRITTIASALPNTVYVGAFSYSNTPKIYRVKNANSSTKSVVDISISGITTGVYPHNISVNPLNPDELIVTFSNYNITGVYYSDNGGTTFSAIEGNLTGSTGNPGPSIRTSAIINFAGTKFYLLGTSTGLYRADVLSGNNTVWEKVESNKIGSIIVNDIEFNPLDGKIAIGTHGRGIFAAKTSAGGLYVDNRIPSVKYSVNEKESISVDLSSVFGGSTDFVYSVASNSNTALLTTSVSSSTLTVEFTDDIQGDAIIVIRGTSGGNYVETSFSVSIGAVSLSVINVIPSVSYDFNEKESVNIDLTNVFGGATDFVYSVTSNSNSALLTPSISSNTLTVAITKDIAGVGTIVVRATSGGAYVETSFSITVNSSTSVEDIQNIDFTIYPNPTYGVCFVTIPDYDYSRLIIRILNIEGKELNTIDVNQSIEMISLSNYSRGIYFIEITGNNKKGVKRIVRR